MSERAIARELGVSDKSIAKALRRPNVRVMLVSTSSARAATARHSLLEQWTARSAENASRALRPYPARARHARRRPALLPRDRDPGRTDRPLLRRAVRVLCEGGTVSKCRTTGDCARRAGVCTAAGPSCTSRCRACRAKSFPFARASELRSLLRARRGILINSCPELWVFSRRPVASGVDMR